MVDPHGRGGIRKELKTHSDAESGSTEVGEAQAALMSAELVVAAEVS